MGTRTALLLTTPHIDDLVNALSVALGTLSDKVLDPDRVWKDEYTDEDRAEMQAKIDRWDALYDDLVGLLEQG